MAAASVGPLKDDGHRPLLPRGVHTYFIPAHDGEPDAHYARHEATVRLAREEIDSAKKHFAANTGPARLPCHLRWFWVRPKSRALVAEDQTTAPTTKRHFARTMNPHRQARLSTSAWVVPAANPRATLRISHLPTRTTSSVRRRTPGFRCQPPSGFLSLTN